MSRKQEIFKTVLTNPYNNDNFIGFVREFLNNVEMVAPNRYVEVKSNFSFYVNGYYHIGNYISDDGDKIAIISVCLNRGDTVERARGMQRNFVKPLIENGGCAGAIVAFYTKDEPNKWRLSFIRMDYEFSKGKVTEKLTPAKRYSYLVGKGEPCHTAQARLYPIFLNDDNNPGLDELEEAFSVEKVTKEFFDLYCEKYHQLREYLESNAEFMAEAEYRKFTSEQFAKKLLGQIVFLYFIQKKGWLGVEAFPLTMTEKAYKKAFFAGGTKSREVMPQVYKQQEDGSYRIVYEKLKKLSEADKEFLAGIVKGKPWGSGPKDFMRKMFEGCKDANKNYFHDYLEPLFYTGLNKNRGENGFYAPLHRRIPFLNGGLFERLDKHEWEHNNFAIPNELFSNADSKGRDADGILDVFDRYNFTMNEDEPMEREVAIDPEMLGKVFENLLDVSDRKSKGAFYTPREIVHYMCQETLINYLVTKSGLPETDIRDFILYGDLMKDEDTTKKSREGNQDMLISSNIFDMQSGVNRLKELDDLLATVRVADLAVGSGAFPLGMLNEIVKARETLSAYMSIEMNKFQKKSFYAYGRKSYDLKVNTIKNCIYACDIEPSAVDIAKLRLWLSIVIDDEIAEDAGNGEFDAHTKPRQLPNLDCNIICGNSLVDEFKGNKLISESQLLHNISQNSQQTIFQSGVDSLLNELIDLQNKLFFIKDHDEKEEIKQSIQKIYDEIILEQLQGNPDLIEEYHQATRESSKPFIIWQLYFPRVFRDNGGFDIVIGNPPYVQLQTMKEKSKEIEHIGYTTYSKTSDLYCIFFEKGLQLLRKDGVLSFITSNKWLRAGYGSSLRKLLIEKANPVLLVDFAGNKVFDTASVDVDILCFQKNEYQGKTKVCTVKELNGQNLNTYITKETILNSFSPDDSWIIFNPMEISIGNKIKQRGIALEKWELSINYGIKTGFNEAYIVNSSTKNKLIDRDSNLSKLFKPILRGRDVKRFRCSFSDLWLLTIHNGIKKQGVPKVDINNYPVLKEYFDTFGDKFKKRTDQGDTPYNLRNCAYMDDFEKKKIIYPETTQGAYFYLDNGEYFIDKTCFMMITKHPEYLVGVLSSSLFEYAYKRIFSSIELGGSAYQYNKKALLQLPVIKPECIDKDIYEQICRIVGILYTKEEKSEDNLLEKLNDIVYKLYDISDEEIRYISSNKTSVEG